MSLPPNLSFLRVGSPAAPHSLEFWLDFVCPFSAKIWKNALDPILKPLVESGALKDKVQILIRLQVQPWHGASLFTHEAALAVGLTNPAAFWPFATKLFAQQTDFFDKQTASLTPTQIREKLATLAASVDGIGEQGKAAVLDKLAYKTSDNGGVDVTNDVKWFVKVARQNSIHVSPTAVWDGVKNDNVSSGWGEKEWSQFWTDNVKA